MNGVMRDVVGSSMAGLEIKSRLGYCRDSMARARNQGRPEKGKKGMERTVDGEEEEEGQVREEEEEEE